MAKNTIVMHRHIDDYLKKWKSMEVKKPLLVKGIRQSGKTYSILKFVTNKNNYLSYIYLNFWDSPDLISCFDGSLKIDDIIKELSVKIHIPELIPGQTVFVFDEIQECPRALLSLKINENDNRFDFIASGSYLGIYGYVIDDNTPTPVGSTVMFDMRTMDFEEFLWAKGFKEEQVNYLNESFKNKIPLSDTMHDFFSRLFREYMCVGGFPEAVKNYILTNNIKSSIEITSNIVENLKSDFGRRRGKNNEPLFIPNEVSRIRNAFSLIPSFLGKENKRYIVSKIQGKGAKNSGKDALEYLKDAGLVIKVHNLEVPSTPLAVNVIANQFKIFPSDIGMLVSMLEDGVASDILSGNLGMSKGMIYEAIVAESLYKRGGQLFYFAKNTGLKLDFVINLNGESTILEVKSQNGNAKSAKQVLANPEHYGKTQLIKITASKLEYKNGVLNIPHYMTYLLFDWSPIIKN